MSGRTSGRSVTAPPEPRQPASRAPGSTALLGDPSRTQPRCYRYMEFVETLMVAGWLLASTGSTAPRAASCDRRTPASWTVGGRYTPTSAEGRIRDRTQSRTGPSSRNRTRVRSRAPDGVVAPDLLVALVAPTDDLSGRRRRRRHRDDDSVAVLASRDVTLASGGPVHVVAGSSDRTVPRLGSDRTVRRSVPIGGRTRSPSAGCPTDATNSSDRCTSTSPGCSVVGDASPVNVVAVTGQKSQSGTRG